MATAGNTPPADPMEPLLGLVRSFVASGYPDLAAVWWSVLKTWLEGQAPRSGAKAAGEREKALGEVLLAMTAIEESQ